MEEGKMEICRSIFRQAAGMGKKKKGRSPPWQKHLHDFVDANAEDFISSLTLEEMDPFLRRAVAAYHATLLSRDQDLMGLTEEELFRWVSREISAIAINGRIRLTGTRWVVDWTGKETERSISPARLLQSGGLFFCVGSFVCLAIVILLVAEERGQLPWDRKGWDFVKKVGDFPPQIRPYTAAIEAMMLARQREAAL